MIIKIKENEVNQNIYFLGKNFRHKEFGDDEIYNYEVLKELNELNTELYINDQKYKYNTCFKFPKKGNYHIKLKFNIQITDCSYMFFNCSNIIDIDLSFFDTQKTNNMNYMLSGISLTNLNLTFLNTKNVKDMSCMFLGCLSLKTLDLSCFNTENVEDMCCMFEACHNLN